MVTTDKIFQTLVIGNPPERAYIKYYVLSQRKCAQVYTSVHCMPKALFYRMLRALCARCTPFSLKLTREMCFFMCLYPRWCVYVYFFSCSFSEKGRKVAQPCGFVGVMHCLSI